MNGQQEPESIIPPGFQRVGPVPQELQTESVVPPGFKKVGPVPQDMGAAAEPSTTKPQSFLESATDATLSRSTFVGVGGMLGGAIGAGSGLLTGPGAPVASPAGAIVGGGIGAAAGSAAFDSYTATKAWLDNRYGDMPSIADTFKAMGKEATEDMFFGIGGAVLQPIRWARAAIGKIAGLSDEGVKQTIETARRLGIGVGAVDVGGVLPKGYSKTIGVFPWTGAPFRKGQVAKLSQADRAAHEILDAFGPNKALSDLGIDMVAAARGTHKEFRRVAAELYNIRNEAIEAASRSDIVPTEIVKNVASDLAEQTRKGLIILENGEPLPRVAMEQVQEYLGKLALLPETITPAQHVQLEKDLSDLIGKSLKDGWDVKQLTNIKGALEEGFSNLRVDLLQPGEGDAILAAQKAAKGFYSKGITKFQTKAAKGFERVDKTIFKVGAEDPGGLNADELYNVAVRLQSPQQIRDLEKLVGKKVMRQAASLHYETAIDAARQNIEITGKSYTFVDPFKLEKQLGLAGVSKKKAAGIRELYRISGVNFDNVTDLISIMKKIEGIGNPAEFVRRRVILTGAGAILTTGAGLYGGMPAGVTTVAAMTLLSRKFSTIFASPVKLQLMMTAMDEARGQAARRAALGRILKMIATEEPESTALNLTGGEGEQ